MKVTKYILHYLVTPPLQLKVTGNGGVQPPKVVDIELFPLKSGEQPHNSHKISLEWSRLHKDWMIGSLVSLLDLCVPLHIVSATLFLLERCSYQHFGLITLYLKHKIL